jgi:eukaryotic-like serine/threonine-protein kinase
MSFAPGQLVGPYEILAPLGAGGMGEVYRARDTRLDREVALKFLPALVAADADRLSRFEREAKALAALNHPHIAQIHAIETVGSVHAIVMELVPGRTLAELIATNGALSPSDAFDIAEQIAEGLEAAHDAGIVHRDLKPGNIKVRPDGTVKVLDFGLAKAGTTAQRAGSQSQDAFNSPTITTPAMTVDGVILGTAAYMSPEQARGKLVDKRTDVWAFGCVLYEMLTGRVPFPGETITDVIAAVVKNEPDWSALPVTTPPAIRTLLARCLQKDPRARLRDIGDARLEILDAKGLESAAPAPSAPIRARFLSGWIALAAAIAFMLGAAAATYWRTPTPAPQPASWTGVLVGGPATVMHPRVSPDGQLLAFQTIVDGLTQLAVMKPDAGTWTVLTGDRSRGLVVTHSWSPDGSRIFFDRATDTLTGIFSVPALGGPERLVVADAAFPLALDNGDLLIQRVNADRRQQLHRFSPSTGAVEPLPAFPDTSISDDATVVSRDGRRVYFFGRRMDDQYAPAAFYQLDLQARTTEPLARGLALRPPVAFALERGTDNILVGGIEGDAFQIVRFGSGGRPTIQPVLSVLAPARFDMDRDGNLFLAIRARPAELFAFLSAAGSQRAPQPQQTLPSMDPREAQTLVALPDGGLLVASRAGERDRLLLVRAGREPSPLIDGAEETRPPAAALGPSQAVVTIGPRAAQALAIVNTADGRIVRRFKAPSADMVTMDASADGRTLYYTAGGHVWSVPLEGGTPAKLGAADSLTVEQETGDLILKLDEGPRIRVMRMKPSSGAIEEIALKGDLRLLPQRPLTPESVRDGKLVLGMSTADSWFWHAATLDLKTGATTKLAAVNPSDIHYATWRADGVPVGLGYGIHTSLWKFARRK